MHDSVCWRCCTEGTAAASLVTPRVCGQHSLLGRSTLVGGIARPGCLLNVSHAVLSAHSKIAHRSAGPAGFPTASCAVQLLYDTAELRDDVDASARAARHHRQPAWVHRQREHRLRRAPCALQRLACRARAHARISVIRILHVRFRGRPEFSSQLCESSAHLRAQSTRGTTLPSAYAEAESGCAAGRGRHSMKSPRGVGRAE
jgi:hypothetical protein